MNLFRNKQALELHFTPFTHRWTIGTFSYLYSNKLWSREQFVKTEIKSADFFGPKEKNRIQFNLVLRPIQRFENAEDAEVYEDDKFVGLFLLIESSVKKRYRIHCQFSVIDYKGKPCHLRDCIMELDLLAKCEMGWQQFIRRSKLRDKHKKYLPNDKLTIHCEIDIIKEKPLRILRELTSDPKLKPKNLKSTIKIKKTWTIEHFSYFYDPTHEQYDQCCVYSEVFPSIHTKEENRFRLQLWPKYSSEENGKFSVAIGLCFTGAKEKTICYKISILDDKGKLRNSLCRRVDGFCRGNGRGWGRYVKSDELLEPMNRLLSEDRLTIFCEIWMYDHELYIICEDPEPSRTDLELLFTQNISNSLFDAKTKKISNGKKMSMKNPSDHQGASTSSTTDGINFSDANVNNSVLIINSDASMGNVHQRHSLS